MAFIHDLFNLSQMDMIPWLEMRCYIRRTAQRLFIARELFRNPIDEATSSLDESERKIQKVLIFLKDQ